MILDVQFEQQSMELRVDFSGETLQFDAEFGEIQKVTGEDVPVYDGSYEVTPLISHQTLETAGKLMGEDMQIKAIPFFETSNTAGGTTVYIGTEI